MQRRELSPGWDAGLPIFPADPKGIAGRDASGRVLNVLAQNNPWLLGGSADLGPSTKTTLTFEGAGDFEPGTPGGRNLHFGIREHAMAAVVNGLSLSKLRAFWKAFFLTGHPVLTTLWGPLVGPLVAIIAFVCSVGNIPLAAVLWNGGISFGGVLAFILADLIVLPILNIYRKYYGLKMAAFLLVTFYVAMAAAALAVEGLFGSLGLIPHERQARVVEASITWNYTTWLNIGFLLLAGILVWRFVKTGGIAMLRMMHRPARNDEAPRCRR